MAVDYSKWDKEFDTEALKQDAENASSREYEDVPAGKYEVKIEKLELTSSKKNDPMVTIWFSILDGQPYAKQKIFMNQVVTQGFQIHKVNELLRSLKSGVTVEFIKYSQYGKMLMDVAEEIDAKGLEYLLDYGKDKKGYNTFEILEVYVQELPF